VDPTPTLDPGTTTLVNLETILTAGPNQSIQSKNATLLGIPITLTATPHFDWVITDLPDIDTDDPGRPYDGTTPASDPGHYVTATWTKTGVKNLALTVHWTGSMVRHDSGETITLTGTVDHGAKTQVTVKQSRAVLTGNS
jgi:hypothetical protein